MRPSKADIRRVLAEALSEAPADTLVEETFERLEGLSGCLGLLRSGGPDPSDPAFTPDLGLWEPPPPAPPPPAVLTTLEDRPGGMLSLAGLSREIGAGRVSPLEATLDCLRRIETLDEGLNSFLTVTGEQAVEQARRLTEELAAGRRRGPLHGVPIGLKDLLATRGIRTTAGSRVLAEWVPDADATVVGRLAAAGAISLGKQNMHEFAFGATGENAHYGRAFHPHDPRRLTGGSSSGSAAAVAGGLCYGSIGSDTGGSIRCPAALCGLVGLKPTYGRVPRTGAVPLAWSLDHLGPITRTVEDAALMLEAIAGHDPLDATSVRLPVPPYSREVGRTVRGLRLAVPREFFWDEIQPGVAAQAREAIETLKAEGAEVREVSLGCMDLAEGAQAVLLYSEAAAYHRPMLRERCQDYGRGILERLAIGLFLSAGDYLDALRARRRVRDELLGILKEADALVTPAVPVVAPVAGQWVQAGEILAPAQRFMVRNTFLFNHTGLPAISVPCGTSDDLPVGLQIAGRPWEEGTLLRLAAAVERSRA